MKKIYILLIPVLLLVSCRDDSGPYADSFVSYDIVQLHSQTSSAGSRFLYYRPDSDAPVEYIESRAVIDTAKIPVGSRLLLGYVADSEPHVSGNITATGYSSVFNSAPVFLPTDTIAGLKARQEGVFLYSIWRSGPFINLHGKATYADDGAVMVLCADTASLSSPMPVLNLDLIYYQLTPKTNFERDFYASFDISGLWESESLTGLVVTLDNTNLQTNTFSFTK